jgi:hypothetical protein
MHIYKVSTLSTSFWSSWSSGFCPSVRTIRASGKMASATGKESRMTRTAPSSTTASGKMASARDWESRTTKTARFRSESVLSVDHARDHLTQTRLADHLDERGIMNPFIFSRFTSSEPVENGRRVVARIRGREGTWKKKENFWPVFSDTCRVRLQTCPVAVSAVSR